MLKANRELLERVINDRLSKAISDKEEDSVAAFNEAMKAIDMQLKIDEQEFELDKEKTKQEFEMKKEAQRLSFENEKAKDQQEFEMEKEMKRQNFELEKDKRNNEFEASENAKNRKFEEKKMRLDDDSTKKDRILKAAEIGAMIAIPLITAGCNKKFAKMLCNFEKDYTFTTTAGRTLGGLFKLK